MVEVSNHRKVVGESAPFGADKFTLGPPPPGAAEKHHTLSDGLVEGTEPWAVGLRATLMTQGMMLVVPLLVCWLY